LRPKILREGEDYLSDYQLRKKPAVWNNIRVNDGDDDDDDNNN